MVRSLNRRSFLTAGATAGLVTIAGCGQDSGAADENAGAGTDEPEITDETPSEEPDGDRGSVSFVLDIIAGIPPNEFESLIIELTGFELRRDNDDSTVTREIDPVRVDLINLASTDGRESIMEATVPAGDYNGIWYFATVPDYTLSNGDGDQTFFNNENPEAHGTMTEPGKTYVSLEDGDSVTIIPVADVREYGGSDDWILTFEWRSPGSFERES